MSSKYLLQEKWAEERAAKTRLPIKIVSSKSEGARFWPANVAVSSLDRLPSAVMGRENVKTKRAPVQPDESPLKMAAKFLANLWPIGPTDCYCCWARNWEHDAAGDLFTCCWQPQ